MDKIKVLVVDDESRMRKLVHDFLSRSNYEVIDYYNNEEVNKLHSQILLSPQDIKEYFEWLFIKGKHYFCGHPGGLLWS